MRPRLASLAILTTFVAGSVTAASGTASAATTGAAPPNAAEVGMFSPAFAEPGPNCETRKKPDGTEYEVCKPTAVSLVVLPNGKLLYWDGLEGTDNIEHSTSLELGQAAVDDQSRVLDVRGPSWKRPSPVDGAAGEQHPEEHLVPDAPEPLKPILNHEGKASYSLFCSDQKLLANGMVITTGGTSYYNEPHLPLGELGHVELEGLRNTRVFDPKTLRWTQVAKMRFGRWYPSMVTLGDGRIFVASGTTKLIKPIYPDNPASSGTNVVQTETFDPAERRWTWNGAKANRSLPLYPRLHLLPNGDVYYDAAGQAFNPFGQAYDEAVWNLSAIYSPKTRTWRNVGIPPLGFRGSTFSIMLPLRAPYTKAEFLSAGGVLGVTPGTYLATDTSQITTIDTTKEQPFSARVTAPLNNARWFSSGVMLPTGQVLAFNGANRDEVDFPGTGFPVQQTEMFDPATGQWSRLASSREQRTYHNSAVLLPDGRVLVGGHAPLPTMYGAHSTLPGGFSHNHRNPTFEIYSPPYLFWGRRPKIGSVDRSVRYGRELRIATPDARGIESVALVRNTASTHLVDGDQRSVMLQIVRRDDDSVVVRTPPNGNVAPAGPYLLFVNRRSDKGLIPSIGEQVFVGAPVPAWLGSPPAPEKNPPPNIPKDEGTPTAPDGTASGSGGAPAGTESPANGAPSAGTGTKGSTTGSANDGGGGTSVGTGGGTSDGRSPPSTTGKGGGGGSTEAPARAGAQKGKANGADPRATPIAAAPTGDPLGRIPWQPLAVPGLLLVGVLTFRRLLTL